MQTGVKFLHFLDSGITANAAKGPEIIELLVQGGLRPND